MEKSTCSFSKLPFSKLFSTYVHDFSRVKDFFSTNPFDELEIANRISRISDYSNRSLVVNALNIFHQNLGISHHQQNPLLKFSDSDALVMVTGQQLGIYGGPLFTIYKTITTILLARKWEKKLNRPVVPVFWLADEDHDFEEIASVGLPGSDGKINMQISQQGKGIPVSEEIIDPSISSLNESLKSALQQTEFSNKLWESLENSYQEGITHGAAFANLLSSWFSDYGLLIAGSNEKNLKSLVKETFKISVKKADLIHQVLESQSLNLENEFHRQVIVNDSNLFFLSENGRTKFHRNKKEWLLNDISFSEDKIISLIDLTPEKFSPNVFLRPIIQDVLLPTIGYIAGPGELAYYAQMKGYYEQFDMEMPIIFPRMSATLIENGINRIMEKLPFELCSYNQRIEDLESKYIELNSNINIDKIFNDWTSSVNTISKKPIFQTQEIDPSLKGVIGKLMNGFENERAKLKGRVIKSLKQQEETQLKRIARVKAQIFPAGLQEREISPIYFMNKFGMDIWDQLLYELQKDELDLKRHYVIQL